MMVQDVKSGPKGAIPVPVGITLPLTFPENYSYHHVLGYSWTSAGPVLTMERLYREGGSLHPSGEVCEVDMGGIPEIDMVISGTRICTGRWAEGGHIHCPSLAHLVTESQCYSCLSGDFPDPVCIFEPHCSSGSCGAGFCQAEHAVYLAVYHDRLKVGMTQVRRLHMRGMEQGADLITAVALLGDRYSARTLECIISLQCSIPQSVHPTNMLKSMRRKFDEDRAFHMTMSAVDEIRLSWDRISERIGTYGGIKVLTATPDMKFQPVSIEYPLQNPLETSPRRLKGNCLKGKIVGFKGGFMIIRSHGLHAYNMHDSIGMVVMCPEYG
ncbi:MAG: DUF2797 domain-containing protein [Thermoplasmatota archaeon]